MFDHFLITDILRMELKVMGSHLGSIVFLKMSIFFKFFCSYFMILGLLARLANQTTGLIDWNPYLPFIFSRVEQMFHLPVKFKKMG